MEDESTPHHKNPIDHALDLFVYAPVGFMAEAPSLLPRFVARGRDQVAMVRAVGMYALRRDPDELKAVVDRHPGTRGTLQALGLVPRAPATSRHNGSAPPAQAPMGSAGPASPDPEPTEPERPREPEVDPATLAIPDYESLSASQVVPRLESLTAGELEAIRQYENGNRARRTILNKIAQLQAS